MDNGKRCSTCGKRKTLCEYSSDKRRRDGKQARCRLCQRKAQKEKYRKDAEHRKARIEYAKKRYEASAEVREKHRASSLRYSQKPTSRERQKENHYKQKYGKGAKEAKQNMLVEQGHRCKICGSRFENAKDTHLDHDHVTGSLRGVLCRMCNTMLGYARDNTVILERAVEYLMENS